MKALAAMLAADVSVHADGGGKRSASMQPIVGFDAVMKFNEFLADHFRTNGSKLVRTGFVNGLPGFITLEADGELQATALDIENGKVTAIYVVRNPDKLRHLHQPHAKSAWSATRDLPPVSFTSALSGNTDEASAVSGTRR